MTLRSLYLHNGHCHGHGEYGACACRPILRGLGLLLLPFLCLTILSSAPAHGKGLDNGNSAAVEHSGVHIKVRSSSFVNSRKFTLGDIAHITAPGFLHGELAALQAGFAPAPGKMKKVSGRRIEAKIRSSKLFSSDMILQVPDTVYVKRASQEISIDDLKAIYEGYVGQHLKGEDHEIRDFSVRGLGFYPEGELSLSSPVNKKGSNLNGRVTLYVDVHVDGRDQGRLSLSAWIDIFHEVVCLSRPMTRGTLLAPSHVRVERRNVSNMREMGFSTIQDVVGKVLTRSARQNRILTVNMVTEPPLVQQGDIVKVVASRGNLRIVTLGIAGNDGKRDEIIQVKNMTSGKMINGVVAGKAEVNVFY